MSTNTASHLIEERHGPVTVLRINRPDKLGALSRMMIQELGSHLESLRADESTRVLVLTGSGRGFVAGADIEEYHQVRQADFDSYQRLSRDVFDALGSLPLPTIAAVNGYAFGGGFELALRCDLIVAAQSARFALPEITLGLIPGGGGTQLLSRLIGIRRTKELVLTGTRMTAEQAADHGIVNRVVTDDTLLEAALGLADTLATRAPLAVREAKRVIDDGALAPLPAALTLEQRALSALFATDDAMEGIRAFVDNHEPRFTGH